MKKKIVIIVGILLITVISLASCSGLATILHRTNTVNYQVDIRDLENANVGTAVASNTVNSCARIIAYFNIGGETKVVSGSGFIVSADGYVITNRHVVVLYSSALSSKYTSDEKSSSTPIAILPDEIRVAFVDDTYYEAEVAYFIDEAGEIDLALLKMKNTGATVFDNLAIDQTSQIYYGQTAFTFGNPEGIGLLFTTVNVANPSMKMSTDGKYYSIMLDGNINHGNSGGVLLDGSSHVIGVIFARIESKANSNTNAYGIGCAIKASDLVDFLVKYNTLAPASKKVNYSEYKPEESQSE